jgi:hypothetical protein
MIISACLTLLLHVLPPFRPLIHRLERADAVALIEIEKVGAQRVDFRMVHRFTGPKLSSAQLLAGHRPSTRALRSLVTFRRRGTTWILQEQAREWVELDQKDWRALPPTTWEKWLKQLKTDPESALLEALSQNPLARFAVRDLNALMLIPNRRELRSRVARLLGRGKLSDSIADSLRHHLLLAAPAAEADNLKRCLAAAKGCLGR